MSTDINTRLNQILDAMDDEIVREQIFHNFHLLNPLEFCRLLHSLPDVSDSVKSALLREKVMQPSAYKGVDLAPVVDRAFQALWTRLGLAD
jgi:hypothetical protein